MALRDMDKRRYQQEEPQNPSRHIFSNEDDHRGQQRTFSRALLAGIPKHIENGLTKTACGILKCLPFLLPSFLVKFAHTGGSPDRRRKQSQKIAALDGLRGVACLFVFHAHYAYSFGNCLEEEPPQILMSRVMYQPYISLLWSGVAMVDVFFFISGYVLVNKSLRLLRKGNLSEAFANISSAVFRRAFRLYIPSMSLILIAALMANFGLFNQGIRVFFHNHAGVLGPQEQPPPFLGSLLLQLYDGFKDCYRLADNTIPWGSFNFPYEEDWYARPGGTVYDKHLWTIPVEFRCSMLIFMMLMATARLRPRPRMTVHSLFVLNCLFTERFPEALFVAGMVLAEVDLIRLEEPLDGGRRLFSRADEKTVSLPDTVFAAENDARRESWIHAQSRWPIEVLLFVCGLFLLSVPAQGAAAYPMYHRLLMAVPLYIRDKDRLIRAIGAIMATWPVATSTALAPLFTNAVSHYLGQISFALYLVHGSVIKSMWYTLLPIYTYYVAPSAVGSLSSSQFITLWILGYLTVLPVTLWAADVFWRTIDQRSILLARSLEEKFLDSTG